METDKDVLDMCNLGTAHPNKDVHVYFEHVADAMLKIVSDDELVDVVIDQVAEEVKEQNGIDSKIKVSILMIGQQAIVDAYLCLTHLTAGILVGKFSK